MIITWQAGSQAADNAKNFGIISDWWKGLQKKSVLWKQRIIPESGEIDWESQRFDDTFELVDPDVRGISVFWKSEEGTEDEKNLTVNKLELNTAKQQLYLYPEGQKDTIISVEVPGTMRTVLQMKNPAWFSDKTADGEFKLTIQDDANQLEVQIELDEGSLGFLKNAVCDLS